jgi:hypothetical protein
MKKFFVSAGLVALGAATYESALADDATGPKYWSVGATLRGFYDDNYAVSGNSKKGSFGVEFLPTISTHVPLQQTDIGLRYTYGLYYYEDRDSVNGGPVDQTHQVDLWLDHAFNERWHGRATDTFVIAQEPELLSGTTPQNPVATPYRVNGDNTANYGTLILDTTWTRLLSTTLTYNNGFYDYQNSGAVQNGSTLTTGSNPGASLEGLLGRDEESGSIELKWDMLPETTASVGYLVTWDDYIGNEPVALDTHIAVFNPKTLAFQPFAYKSSDRNAVTHTGYLGLSQTLTPDLSADIKVGASYVDEYADPLFPSTTWTPYVDLSASYIYLPGNYVQLGFTHETGATDQVTPDSTGHITQFSESSVVYLDVTYSITAKLLATGIGRVQYSTYNGGAVANDATTDYGLGLNLIYQINHHFSADLGYNYDNVVSDIVGYGYSRNRVYLGLTANY